MQYPVPQASREGRNGGKIMGEALEKLLQAVRLRRLTSMIPFPRFFFTPTYREIAACTFDKPAANETAPQIHKAGQSETSLAKVPNSCVRACEVRYGCAVCDVPCSVCITTGNSYELRDTVIHIGSVAQKECKEYYIFGTSDHKRLMISTD